MIITAELRIQNCGAYKAFVACDGKAHGSGEVALYQAIAPSWSHIRCMLKLDSVIGAHRVKAGSVQKHSKDIGITPARLRRLR